MGQVATYFKRIGDSAKSIVIGMGITWRYMVRPKEIVTIQYGSKTRAPTERYLPDRHRGIHYLETEKCIHCHICEKACPVDCIEMDGSREAFADAWVGDGCHMSKFILDLNKCIFCNLCCEPCPKECIHMGQEFDVAGYDRANGVKNLLTDGPWSREDREREARARQLIEEAEAEAKRKKAEARKKAAAAKAKAKAEAEAKANAEKKPQVDPEEDGDPAAPGGDEPSKES
jgi:formate hydrogenlyase subunit 6/NADH:ubiquinone oxidoreductase subunit I